MLGFRLSILALISSLLFACNSVNVEKLNPDKPSGVPFYLTKPVKETTTIQYVFYDISQKPYREIGRYQSKESRVVNVIDKDAAYTLNHTRAFAGESSLKINRSAAENGISSSDIASIEVTNKEGITEFLKGLFEGAKTLTEAAAQAKEAGLIAGALSEHEATYFQNLLEKDILATKEIVSVDYSDL